MSEYTLESFIVVCQLTNQLKTTSRRTCELLLIVKIHLLCVCVLFFREMGKTPTGSECPKNYNRTFIYVITRQLYMLHANK